MTLPLCVCSLGSTTFTLFWESHLAACSLPASLPCSPTWYYGSKSLPLFGHDATATWEPLAWWEDSGGLTRLKLPAQASPVEACAAQAAGAGQPLFCSLSLWALWAPELLPGCSPAGAPAIAHLELLLQQPPGAGRESLKLSAPAFLQTSTYI